MSPQSGSGRLEYLQPAAPVCCGGGDIDLGERAYSGIEGECLPRPQSRQRRHDRLAQSGNQTILEWAGVYRAVRCDERWVMGKGREGENKSVRHAERERLLVLAF